MSDVLPGANIPIWGAYLKLLQKNPLKVKAITTAVIMSLSQTSSQFIEKGKVHNPRLILAWIVWGFPSATGAHFFNNWMVKHHGSKPLLVKVVMDHILYRLAIMLAFTYWNKVWFTGATNLGFVDAWKETLKVQWSMQKTSAKLWPTLMLANYTVIPLPLRVLYLNICQFSWALYLSFFYKKTTQKSLEDKEKEKAK